MKRRIQIVILLVAALCVSSVQAAPKSMKATKPIASVSEREDLQNELINAIHAHDLSQIKVWLARGAQINFLDKNGETPFLEAVALGVQKSKSDVIRFFISKGANVNARMKNDFSALHLASGFGNVEIAKLLISKGAMIGVADTDGVTPLLCAAATPYKGGEEIALMLIALGANVSSKTKAGSSVIWEAAKRGKNILVKTLASRGANVNAADKQGLTPLMMAARNDKSETIRELILLGANVDASDVNKDTALASAIKRGNKASIKVLLDNNANLQTRNAVGDTPLSLAEAGKNPEIIALVKQALEKK